MVCHPFVIGELACGSMRSRSGVLTVLQELPQATVASPAQDLALLEARRLMGRGFGFVDVSLLASATLDGASLWTLD